MKIATLAATAAIIGAAGFVVFAGDRYAPIVGVARTIDGDTIEIGNVRVRLQGLDSPELEHHGGAAAKRAVQAIIGNDLVSCRLDGTKSHDRAVAICRLPDGRDIAGELVRRGHGLDCRRFSNGRYRDLETDAARRSQRRAPYCSGGEQPAPRRRVPAPTASDLEFDFDPSEFETAVEEAAEDLVRDQEDEDAEIEAERAEDRHDAYRY